MQACSNKYMPIDQWLYYDAHDILPPFGDATSDAEFQASAATSPYAVGLVATLGADATARLQAMRSGVAPSV